MSELRTRGSRMKHQKFYNPHQSFGGYFLTILAIMRSGAKRLLRLSLVDINSGGSRI